MPDKADPELIIDPDLFKVVSSGLLMFICLTPLETSTATSLSLRVIRNLVPIGGFHLPFYYLMSTMSSVFFIYSVSSNTMLYR